MAEPITIQKLIDASMDSDSLEVLVNGDENAQVTTRLGETYPSAKKAIKTIFENGGIPAVPFTTKALMTASALADGKYAMVTDGGTDNGLYLKTVGTWVKSAYDPLSQAKTYVDSFPTVKAILLTSSSDLNNIKETGIYIQKSSGNISLDKGYPIKLAGTLEVIAGDAIAVIQKYTTFSTAQTFIRNFAGLSFTAWRETTITALEKWEKPHSLIEWVNNEGGSITYNRATKTVTQIGDIVAPYPNASGRIKLEGLNVTFTGSFQYCYLDLKALGDSTVIDAVNIADCIKVASYFGSGELFRANKNQHPLFKYDYITGNVTACAGFIPFDVAASSSAQMTFSKQADMLYVYFPMPNGSQLRSGLAHNVVGSSDLSVTQSNADLWRIFEMHKVDKDGLVVSQIANAGEFELAMTHTENTQSSGVTKDHVGGFHGDELATDVKFFVDGVLKPANFVSSLKSFRELQVIQHSVIYYQNTARPLCDHLKIITYKDNKINVKQRVNFKYEDTSLNTAWVTMLPILRVSRVSGSTQVTDKSSFSTDYFLQVDDDEGVGRADRFVVAKDGTKIKQWSSTSGISAETTLIKTVNDGSTPSLYVLNAEPYNKLYSSAIDGSVLKPTPIPLNTVWEIESEYNIKC